MSGRATIILTAGAVLLTASAGIFLFAMDRAAERTAIALAEAEEQAEAARLAIEFEDEDSEQRQAEAASARTILDEWRDLGKGGVIAVLERVESHAGATSVVCDDVSRVTDGPPDQRAYRVLGSGEPTAVAAFLAALEGDGPLSLITSFSIASSTGPAPEDAEPEPAAPAASSLPPWMRARADATAAADATNADAGAQASAAAPAPTADDAADGPHRVAFDLVLTTFRIGEG